MFLNSYPSSSLNNLIWTMPATSAVFPSMNGHNTMARFKCSILHQQSFTRQVMSAASMACSASIFVVLPSGEIKHLVSTVSLWMRTQKQTQWVAWTSSVYLCSFHSSFRGSTIPVLSYGGSLVLVMSPTRIPACGWYAQASTIDTNPTSRSSILIQFTTPHTSFLFMASTSSPQISNIINHTICIHFTTSIGMLITMHSRSHHRDFELNFVLLVQIWNFCSTCKSIY